METPDVLNTQKILAVIQALWKAIAQFMMVVEESQVI
jgi:hypothetical protein